MRLIRLFAALIVVSTGLLSAAEKSEEAFKNAREHYQKGRYQEAIDDLEALAKSESGEIDFAKIAILHSDAELAQGERDKAEAILLVAIQKQDSAALEGRLAKIYYERGRNQDAETAVAKSLELDPDNLQARLIQAHLNVEKGELKKADEGFRWFVRYYNQNQPTDAETLVYVAQGASQYALWHSSSQILDFCVNTVGIDAIKADKLYWQAHLVSGHLLLEKYNKAQGLPELKSALAINPNAADVHIEIAKSAIGEYKWDEVEEEGNRALQICPKAPGALRALATAKLYFRETDEAEKFLTEALEVNPVDTQTLALVAALRMLQDGWPEATRWKQLISHLDQIDDLKLDNPTRCEQIVIDVARRNPKPGIFLASLAEAVDMFRQHTIAEPLLKQATLLMPQLSKPKNALGQLYMQTGQIEDAKRTLDEAFKSDPYHVRVRNMIKVIKVLDDYDTISTDHFIVRADGKLDKLLARYMAEYLEEVYPELTELFQFQPESRTQIEIYNTAKGLSGHQWFSARMIGLPWVQTIGASTGVIIAMQSPGSMENSLNWARVLKHEFVHVLTLQQTNFNIPHWYTEALAVRSEGYPRPVEWNKLLLDRVPKRNLKNLDNLSMGFIRAGNQENWNFAYCQSLLYAEYMVERFGEPSLAKLLDAYRRNLTTTQAIPEVFGVEKADFEEGYLKYLDRIVAGIQKSEDEPEQRPSQIEKEYEKDKSNPKAAANYARLLLLSRRREDARELAEKILKKEPTQPVAAGVLGYLYLREERYEEAVKVLQPALDEKHPNKTLLEFLMRARLKLKQPEAVMHLCEIGKEHFPYVSDWWRGIAGAAKLTGEVEKRREALVKLVQIEADDPAPRKALAELALSEKQYETAYKYAKLALHIDVLDAETHRMLAESCRHRNDMKRAIDEYEVALELKPKDAEIQLGLADLYVELGRMDDAKKLTAEVLKTSPDDARAKSIAKQADK